MSGGYRLLVFGALFAFSTTLLGLGWMLGTTAGYERTANAQIVGTGSICRPDSEQANSESCAQWSAVAAADRANIIEGISGVLVIVALGFAFQANKIARDTAKRQLRAYLYVELKEPPKLELGGWPQGEFWLKNGGQTPAHNVEIASAFSIGKFPFEGEPPAIPEDAFGGRSHKAPNCPSVLICKAAEGGITQKWIDAINKGSRRIVMYGEIRYEDVFGERHVTKYRAEFGGPDTAGGDRVLWAPNGNEAD